MMKYVPRTKVPARTDECLKAALRELVLIQYFREHHKSLRQA
jgi:hypothetical protein